MVLSGLGSDVAFEDLLQFSKIAFEAIDLGDESFGTFGCASKAFDDFIKFECEFDGLGDVPAGENHVCSWTQDEGRGRREMSTSRTDEAAA